jgi:hypothetical protein
VLELGVALEAHGQNLLVVLSPANAPVRLVYRDLADIRISPARLARHGIPATPLSGRLTTDDDTALRRKQPYCGCHRRRPATGGHPCPTLSAGLQAECGPAVRESLDEGASAGAQKHGTG